LFTKRNDNKPKHRLIAVSMMVFLCLLLAILAVESMNRNYFASLNGMLDGSSCLPFFRMEESYEKVGDSTESSAFFSMAIVFLGGFMSFGVFLPVMKRDFTGHNPTSFRLAGYLDSIDIANFTLAAMAIKFDLVSVKFRKGFNFLASCASFCLNCLRHGDLLNRLSCLEPQVSHNLICGSFYCITSNQQVNPIFRRN